MMEAKVANSTRNSREDLAEIEKGKFSRMRDKGGARTLTFSWGGDPLKLWSGPFAGQTIQNAVRFTMVGPHVHHLQHSEKRTASGQKWRHGAGIPAHFLSGIDVLWAAHPGDGVKFCEITGSTHQKSYGI